ncbi:hypothetical protein BU17DRAFT_64251 [Hysterangium stoloniferum]|nr:hypothetical protein BU17DRAFT_64251 [Hysterangium stoloniferum]
MQVPVRPQRKMKYGLTVAGFEVKQTGHNLFQNKSDGWLPALGPGVYGGQIMALALLSATKTVDSKYVLSCSFLLPAIPTIPTIYSVESLRDGRSYCLRAVRVQQSGKTIVTLECTFQLPEPLQLRFEASCPDVPTPENCQSEVDWYMEALARPNLDLLEHSSVDARFAKEWKADDGTFICCRWLKVVDSTYDWLLYVEIPCKFATHIQITSLVGGSGRGVSLGRIYTRSGTLVALYEIDEDCLLGKWLSRFHIMLLFYQWVLVWEFRRTFSPFLRNLYGQAADYGAGMRGVRESLDGLQGIKKNRFDWIETGVEKKRVEISKFKLGEAFRLGDNGLHEWAQ